LLSRLITFMSSKSRVPCCREFYCHDWHRKRDESEGLNSQKTVGASCATTNSVQTRGLRVLEHLHGPLPLGNLRSSCCYTFKACAYHFRCSSVIFEFSQDVMNRRLFEENSALGLPCWAGWAKQGLYNRCVCFVERHPVCLIEAGTILTSSVVFTSSYLTFVGNSGASLK
jgi:hypothetical protein